MLTANSVENLHIRYCKSILGARCSTQNDMVRTELGRIDMYHTMLVNVMKYWLKVITANLNRYISRAYYVLLQDVVKGARNWASLIQDILFTMTMSDVWHSQSVGNVKLVICIFRQRVRDINMQAVSSRLQETTRASLYLMFNPNLVFSEGLRNCPKRTV